MLGNRTAEAPKPKRILVSDPIGDGARAVAAKAAETKAEVAVFEQAGALALEASSAGADLIVIFRPDSLAPLERLRNDPRTRHIPIVLVSKADEPEKRLLAVSGADQIVDYPFELSILLPWIEGGLKGDFHRGLGGEFAEAKPGLEGHASWLGRLSWVSTRTARFECDVALPEDAVLPLQGPLVSSLGLDALDARVISRSRNDLFYNHEYRFELELAAPAAVPSIAAALAAESRALASRKRKIAVVATDSGAVRRLASTLDNTRFALRWIPTLEGLGAALQHLAPVLVVVDPGTEGLHERQLFGGLLRAAKQGLAILPLCPPEGGLFWERAAEAVSRRDVPPLERGSGWDELVESLSAPAPDATDPERVYLRRDHAFSHARIVVPCTLSSLTEVGGVIDLEYGVAADARARLELPALDGSGIRPLHGRTLRATRTREPARLTWMGVGNEAETKALRFFIQESIMAKRRKQFEAIPPVPVTVPSE